MEAGIRHIDTAQGEEGNCDGTKSASREMGSILEQNSWHQSSTVKKLDINYLKTITKNFSEDRILGRGGYGIVYKGEQENGDVVAVKKLTIRTTGMDDKLFMNEVKHVMDICHPNIVRLEGYCYHKDAEIITFHNGHTEFVDDVYRLLCFEYLPNGSLDKYLNDESSELDWHTRYSIIEGICAGLYCLHEGRKGVPILHMDLKPSNILLDKNMTPKIADFGLSRLFDEGKTHTTTSNAVGTRGYMAPEYIDRCILSKESDIFSLGVMIIEIMAGHRKYPEGTSEDEFNELYEKWKTKLQKTSNKTLWEEGCQQVYECMVVGLKCMAKDPKKRPKIREIVESLGRIGCSVRDGRDRIAIGIDLGTTYSSVGIWCNGRVEIVANDQGNRTTPSCVVFTNSMRLIGEGDKTQVTSNASNTVFHVKRLIGRSFSDTSVKRNAKCWPFDVIEGPNDRPRIKVSYLGQEKEFSPEEISAMVLLKMKETAEVYTGRTITDAVITVPAYFNSSQRQATKDAGVIAGLNVMRIINEPTAAAMAYHVNRKWGDTEERIVLVYDLGGGMLDVSLIVVKKGALQVRATAGDTHLGGEDFTNNMVDHFVNEFKSQNQRDISSDKKALWRLRGSCEKAKRMLSTNQRDIPVEVNAIFEGIDFHSTITRDQFEKLNEDLIRRCREPIAKCLMDAKMDKSRVDDVVLVGGSTCIPCVHQLVQDFFNGKELCRNINADEAVAYGATFQAGMLMGPNRLPVLDITPFSQGIGMLEGLMCMAVPRNSTIPGTSELEFTTGEDDQSSMDITLYEGDTGKAKKFHFSGIALAPKGVPKIKVRFVMDMHGLLHLSAKDEEGNITITYDAGRFSMEEIQRMVQDAQKYKARNDIENLLCKMRNSLKLEDKSAVVAATSWLQDNELTTCQLNDKKKQLERIYNMCVVPRRGSIMKTIISDLAGGVYGVLTSETRPVAGGLGRVHR